VLATIGVVGQYLRHRLLGEPPYPDETSAAAIPEPLPALSAEQRPHPMDDTVRKKP